jgi:hypothetical protein
MRSREGRTSSAHSLLPWSESSSLLYVNVMRRVIWYVAIEQEGEELALIEIFVYTRRS